MDPFSETLPLKTRLSIIPKQSPSQGQLLPSFVLTCLSLHRPYVNVVGADQNVPRDLDITGKSRQALTPLQHNGNIGAELTRQYVSFPPYRNSIHRNNSTPDQDSPLYDVTVVTVVDTPTPEVRLHPKTLDPTRGVVDSVLEINPILRRSMNSISHLFWLHLWTEMPQT